MCVKHRIPSLLLPAMGILLNACAQSEPVVLPDGPGHVVALENPAIEEASGLAVSRVAADRIWLHNDSGGAARLYAVDRQGRSLGEVDLPALQNLDWEDMDAFVLDDRPMLLIADVGDNSAQRPVVTLHWLEEPEPDQSARAVTTSLHLRYPDGPRDCEAVAVDSGETAIYLLTKRDQPPRLYRVPLAAQPLVATAEFVGTVNSIPEPTEQDLLEDPAYGANRSQPTAMSFAADGRRALVVTYKDAYLYERQDGESWLAALNRAPQRIDLPQLPQTEAGGMRADGRTAYVASEQLPAAMVEVALP